MSTDDIYVTYLVKNQDRFLFHVFTCWFKLLAAIFQTAAAHKVEPLKWTTFYM